MLRKCAKVLTVKSVEESQISALRSKCSVRSEYEIGICAFLRDRFFKTWTLTLILIKYGVCAILSILSIGVHVNISN